MSKKHQAAIKWRVDSRAPLSGEEKSVIAERMLEIGATITGGACSGEISMGARHMEMSIRIRTTPELLEMAKDRAHKMAGCGWGKALAMFFLWIKGSSDKWEEFMDGLVESCLFQIKMAILLDAKRRLVSAVAVTECVNHSIDGPMGA